jgi:hypothetical protein
MKKAIIIFIIILSMGVIGCYKTSSSLTPSNIQENIKTNKSVKQLLEEAYPDCEVDIDVAGAAMIVKKDGTYFFLSAEEVKQKTRR